MPENIDDVDEHVDEEVEVALEDDEVLEDLEPTPEELAEATVPPEPGLENVESIQDLLAKQESQDGQEEAADDEDEVTAATSTRDERLEPLYWILLFGALAWLALTTLSATSIALVGAVGPSLLREGRPIRSGIGFASLWTAVDWIRGMFPLGGFTWGSVGISQVDDRTLLPLATIAGVWGITLVVVVVNVLLFEALTGRRGASVRRAGLGVAALTLILAPFAVPFSEPTGDPLDVAVVQVDVRPPPNTSAVQEDLLVARKNIALDRTLVGSTPRPDLVLWGEGALDPAASGDPATMVAVQRAIADVGVPTAVGAVMDDPGGLQRTSELVFGPEGSRIDRYDKVHLVPFGEYVPWRSRLDWISATRQIPVDRTPGSSVHTVDAPGLPPFGTPICFENSFPAIPP